MKHTTAEEELIKKYRQKLDEELNNEKTSGKPAPPSRPVDSKSYIEFKEENRPRHHSLYEKLCGASECIIKIHPSKKQEEILIKQLKMCHLEVTPTGAFSFSLLSFLAIFITVGTAGFLLFASSLFYLYALLISLIALVAIMKIPEFLSNNWRLKASNQMVQCIFYLVTYMRHTSNIELAVRFAEEHLTPPLSTDLKKVLWNVETGEQDTVQESLDAYLETWRDYNLEFIESVHLIEGSLYEQSEEKRLSMLDKSLSVMLQETYEKMLRYSHDLKSPVTMLYMLGIILPILGLVILPLVASFMTNDSAPLRIAAYVSVLYNFTLPVIIYYLSRMVLSKRPTGYGDSDISEQHPELRKFRNIILKSDKREISVSPMWISIIFGCVLFFIGLTPLIAGMTFPSEGLINEPTFGGALQFKLLDYKLPKGPAVTGLIGPYGIGASVLSILIPISLGVGIGLYFHLRSFNLLKIRENTKKLEAEFASAIFQLGNRLGDGVPSEIAFGKVADVMKGTKSGEFFSKVDTNIRIRGRSLESALFSKQYGAVWMFPSSVIMSSMKVLIESSKKGPKIASQTMINVSEYLKEIHRVDERLRDLMAELISDMKQQIKGLAPAIAGIVVGITSMIVTILGKLTEQLQVISTTAGTGANVPAGLITLFGDGVPTYYFQTIVGIYVVQIVYVLTIMVNGIENGADKLAERYYLGKNLIQSTLIYSLIALALILLFNVIATSIMQGLNAA